MATEEIGGRRKKVDTKTKRISIYPRRNGTFDVVIMNEVIFGDSTLEQTTNITRKEVDKFITDSLAKHLGDANGKG